MSRETGDAYKRYKQTSIRSRIKIISKRLIQKSSILQNPKPLHNEILLRNNSKNTKNDPHRNIIFIHGYG